MKPKLKLVGTDGNAFSILGRARRVLKAAERAGEVPPGTTEEYLEKAKSGDYSNLLATTMDYLDVS